MFILFHNRQKLIAIEILIPVSNTVFVCYLDLYHSYFLIFIDKSYIIDTNANLMKELNNSIKPTEQNLLPRWALLIMGRNTQPSQDPYHTFPL